MVTADALALARKHGMVGTDREVAEEIGDVLEDAAVQAQACAAAFNPPLGHVRDAAGWRRAVIRARAAFLAAVAEEVTFYYRSAWADAAAEAEDDEDDSA